MLSPTIYAQFLKRIPKPLYRFLAKRWIDYEFPRHIFVELTSECNLRCSYCPRPRISRELPFGLFQKIVDEASLYGKRSFSLHLFGEPLLCSYFDEAVEYLKSKGHTVLITTNGTFIGDHIKSLKNCDKIIWSYKENIKIPEEIKSWKNFTVRFFGKVVGKWRNTEVRNLHNYGGQLPFSAQCTEKRWACYHPFFAPAVNSNGEILICCADPKGLSKIGNIQDISIAQAWKLMEPIRQQHKEGRFLGICENCDVWKSYPSFY